MEGYQLKITIKGSTPPVWRRVIVPAKISFADLDEVIECIFGWEHDHMYEFYFPKEKASIVMQDDYDDGIVAGEVCIDSWIGAGARFDYTYDFGDNWEHVVEVEKLVPYENRYARVVKSAGPYMIEDCGGIWGFYDCIDEAVEFDIDEANRRLECRKFEEFDESEGIGPDDWKKIQKEQEDFLRKLCYDMIDNTKIPPLEIPLKEVYAGYRKDDLLAIARLYGFRGYSKYNKKELAEWLAGHLLDTANMRRAFKSLTRDEMEHFEAAMEGCGFMSEELVSESAFLCTYGAYNNAIGTLLIPKDVREQYQKICTPEFREELERDWRIADYCASAVYLYGIVPVGKLAEICRGYGEDIIEDDIYALSGAWDGEIGEGRIQGELLIGEQFLEDELYRRVLKDQGDVPYYIPETREEFLKYGENFCQEPDGHTERFIVYLQDRYQMEYSEALTAFHVMQSAIQANIQISELVDILEDILDGHYKKFKGAKNIKEAKDQLKNLQNYTRILRYRGHTKQEYRNLQGAEQVQSGKVILFPGSKKIYPNDPCPCGSGKKYKKCCGKNK